MTARKGFTLIELLVVIAIIAVLMSILMPALGRARRQGQAMVCMSRLKSWGVIYKLYTDDNHGSFPLGWERNDTDQWMIALRPYYNDEWKMLLCPSAVRLVLGAGDSATWKAWDRTIGGHQYIGSYGNNSWMDPMTKDRGARRREDFWRTTQNVVNASTVPVLGDSTWHDAWPRHTDVPVQDLMDFGSGDKGAADEMNHFCIDRHHGWTHLVFADWSVRRVGLKELWTLRWNRGFDVNGPWTKAGGATEEDWPPWLRKYPAY